MHKSGMRGCCVISFIIVVTGSINGTKSHPALKKPVLLPYRLLP